MSAVATGGGTIARAHADGRADGRAELRDAATVLLVRDGPDGIEAMVLRRNLRSDFIGGAYVFPGGAIDPGDSDPEAYANCAGLDDADASTRLGIERDGLAVWVAGVRECFEEAGLLLARTRGSERVLSFADPEVAARFDEHRRAVDDGRRTLAEVCAREDIELAADDLVPVARWITPVVASRRYDTWFLLGRGPREQVALHDDREVIANLWVRPATALAAHRRGELDMMYPTVCLLEWLAAAGSADAALAAAAALGEITAVEPRIVDDGRGGRLLSVAGDPEYGSAPDAVGPGEHVAGAELLRLCRARVLAHHGEGD